MQNSLDSFLCSLRLVSRGLDLWRFNDRHNIRPDSLASYGQLSRLFLKTSFRFQDTIRLRGNAKLELGREPQMLYRTPFHERTDSMRLCVSIGSDVFLYEFYLCGGARAISPFMQGGCVYMSELARSICLGNCLEK